MEVRPRSPMAIGKRQRRRRVELKVGTSSADVETVEEMVEIAGLRQARRSGVGRGLILRRRPQGECGNCARHSWPT